MYRTIIEMKEDTPKETLAEIKALCIAAHKNRAGEVKMKPINDRTFIFIYSSRSFGCRRCSRETGISSGRSDRNREFCP